MKAPRSLRTWLALLLGAEFALAAGLLVAGWLYLRAQTVDTAARANAQLAYTTAAFVDRALHEPQEVLAQAAQMLAVLDVAWEQRLSTRLSTWTYFESFTILDRDGRVTLAVPPGAARPGEDRSGTDEFRRSRSQAVAWSDTFLSPLDGRPLIACAVPFRGGALVGRIRLAPFAQHIGGEVLGTAGVAIVDTHGTWIVHAEARRVDERGIATAYVHERARRGADSFTFRETGGGREMVVAAHAVPTTGWTILVSRPATEVYAAVDGLLRVGIPFVAVFGLSVLLLGAAAYRRLRTALTDLERGAGRIARGEYGERLAGGAYTELDVLASHVNVLGDAVAARERRLVGGEAQLRASEEKFARAFQASPMGIAISRLDDGRYIDVNDELVRMAGYRRDEIVGRTATELGFWLDPADRKRYIDGLRAAGHLRDYQVAFRVGTGEIRLFSASCEIIVIDGVECGLNILVDITERREAEEARARLEAQLRQEQKLSAVGTLASGVAHEINNPLTGVINYAQLISDRLAAGPPTEEGCRRLAEFAGEIIAEGDRVASIVRKLLAFSRQDEVRYEPTAPGEVVEAILALMHKLLEKDDIRVAVELPPDLPAMRCSSPQIQQVLLNLVTNARDATTERWQGYHPDKVLVIGARGLADDEGRWVRISVTDRGPGIPPEVAARVFDPFFSTKSRDKGTGLGLSISYGIVKEHGGRLSFESAPGRGTTFHLDLPEATP